MFIEPSSIAYLTNTYSCDVSDFILRDEDRKKALEFDILSIWKGDKVVGYSSRLHPRVVISTSPWWAKSIDMYMSIHCTVTIVPPQDRIHLGGDYYMLNSMDPMDLIEFYLHLPSFLESIRT